MKTLFLLMALGLVCGSLAGCLSPEERMARQMEKVEEQMSKMEAKLDRMEKRMDERNR